MTDSKRQPADEIFRVLMEAVEAGEWSSPTKVADRLHRYGFRGPGYIAKYAADVSMKLLNDRETIASCVRSMLLADPHPALPRRGEERTR